MAFLIIMIPVILIYSAALILKVLKSKGREDVSFIKLTHLLVTIYTSTDFANLQKSDRS